MTKKTHDEGDLARGDPRGDIREEDKPDRNFYLGEKGGNAKKSHTPPHILKIL